MVVESRIALLRDQAANGHEIALKFSVGSQRKSCKVKVWVGAQQSVVPAGARRYTLAAIDTLHEMVSSSIVNDRGHKHSSGCSEVEFFIQDLPVPIEPPISTTPARPRESNAAVRNHVPSSSVLASAPPLPTQSGISVGTVVELRVAAKRKLT